MQIAAAGGGHCNASVSIGQRICQKRSAGLPGAQGAWRDGEPRNRNWWVLKNLGEQQMGTANVDVFFFCKAFFTPQEIPNFDPALISTKHLRSWWPDHGVYGPLCQDSGKVLGLRECWSRSWPALELSGAVIAKGGWCVRGLACADSKQVFQVFHNWTLNKTIDEVASSCITWVKLLPEASKQDFIMPGMCHLFKLSPN